MESHLAEQKVDGKIFWPHGKSMEVDGTSRGSPESSQKVSRQHGTFTEVDTMSSSRTKS